MGTPDFTKLLGGQADDSKPPPTVPAGSYRLLVKGSEFGASSVKETPFVRFNFQITALGPDIDPDDLAGIKWETKALRRDFYLTEDALFMLTDFFKTGGLKTDGRTHAELVPMAVGMELVGNVTVTAGRGDRMYNNVDSFASDFATDDEDE